MVNEEPTIWLAEWQLSAVLLLSGKLFYTYKSAGKSRIVPYFITSRVIDASHEAKTRPEVAQQNRITPSCLMVLIFCGYTRIT